MSSTKKLFDNLDDIVEDAVEGLLLTDPFLARVDNIPSVVVRRDVEIIKKRYVTLISGGGSGHEPAHAGFIGHGMLTAAVLGNVFASPSVAQVLAAIRVCAGPCGCLLIVKNYTGDRLNFGMAMEKARSEGLRVEMVVVGDDSALPEGKGITGGRGIAGTCFVHKIAGASAAAGADLKTVLTEAQAAADSVKSLGVALTTCTVPGTPSSDRLADPNVYEVGLGIHGEPGREQRSLEANMATSVAKTLVSEILLRLSKETVQCAILVNNLGSLPMLELLVVTKCVIRELEASGMQPQRAYVGTYMTSLEMAGVSLSILPMASSSVSVRLDAQTTAPAWHCVEPLCLKDGKVVAASVPYTDNDARTIPSGGPPVLPIVRSALVAVCEHLISMEPELTRYDAICGDGDCGIVMKKGAQRVLADVVSYSDDSATFCDSLATSIGSAMGGTSGALLELFFRAAANNLSETSAEKVGFHCVVEALLAGSSSMQFYGGAKVGMRTMLDALVPAVEQLKSSIAPENEAALLSQMEQQLKVRSGYGDAPNITDGDARAMSTAVCIALASVKAREGCEATKAMKALAGRSNYVNEELMSGYPDPGALAVAAMFEVAGRVLYSAVGK